MQESVSFRRLGLAVIDEQHRFGVEQRAALIGKGAAPDVLLLTATPIPRSLALTLYGDLDVSTLRERPPGRGSVRTAVRGAGQRDRVLEFVRTECAQRPPGLHRAAGHRGIGAGRPSGGHQHGPERWPPAGPTCASRWCTAGSSPRSATTSCGGSAAGEIQVLVATTVIEVGIDVPDATIMVIEHPDRFGLAQLHQLRGRIGRGAEESYCILLADGEPPPRLTAFAATTDGFRIAELDLEERGMGDLIGARQSGGVEVRHARLPADADLLQQAREHRRPAHRRGPGPAAPRAPAAPGAGGEPLSQGGRAVPDRMTRAPPAGECPTRQSAVRSRSPASGSALPARTGCCPACRCVE